MKQLANDPFYLLFSLPSLFPPFFPFNNFLHFIPDIFPSIFFNIKHKFLDNILKCVIVNTQIKFFVDNPLDCFMKNSSVKDH
ncbi:hypothetical protein RIR_jg22398.t1 [Rhizophagus irregularis DAOM 181602=DAOM 197198]|nr:hypothetical protein RhiirB3_41966 [Rhizophagus irregularis]GET62358.1 hypothetical protein RIR_jg22398.t1 [Rhizophagus irregularis DAOM 181602=DAOM 197198]